jgi:hypothetical protein
MKAVAKIRNTPTSLLKLSFTALCILAYKQNLMGLSDHIPNTQVNKVLD